MDLLNVMGEDSDVDLDILDTFFTNNNESTAPEPLGEREIKTELVLGSAPQLPQESKTMPFVTALPQRVPLTPAQPSLLTAKLPAFPLGPETKRKPASPFASPLLFPPNPTLRAGNYLPLGFTNGLWPSMMMQKSGATVPNGNTKLPVSPSTFSSPVQALGVSAASGKRTMPFNVSPYHKAQMKLEPGIKVPNHLQSSLLGVGSIAGPAVSKDGALQNKVLAMEPIKLETGAAAGNAAAAALLAQKKRWLCPKQPLTDFLTAGKRGHAAITPASAEMGNAGTTGGERGGGMGLSREDKKKRRLIRNRKSAQLHRERKKAFIDSLKLQVSQLSAQNTQLKTMLAQVVATNQQLRRQQSLLQANQHTHRSRATCPNCGDFPSILEEDTPALLDPKDGGVGGGKGYADFSSDSSALDTPPPSPPHLSPGRSSMLLFALVFSFVFLGGNLPIFASWDVGSIPPAPGGIASNVGPAMPGSFGAGPHANMGMMFSPKATADSAGFELDQPIGLSGGGTGRVLLMAAEEAADDDTLEPEAADVHVPTEQRVASAPLPSAQEAPVPERAGDLNKALALWKGEDHDRMTALWGSLVYLDDNGNESRDGLEAAAVALLQQRGYHFQQRSHHRSGEDKNVIPLPLSPVKAAIDLNDPDAVGGGGAQELMQTQRAEAIAVYLAAHEQREGLDIPGGSSATGGRTIGTNRSLVMCPQAHGLLSESFLQRTARAQGLPDGWWWDVPKATDTDGSAAASATARVHGAHSDADGRDPMSRNQSSFWELAPPPRLRLGARKGSAPRLAGPNGSSSAHSGGAADLLLLVPSDSLHWGGWGNTRSQDSSSGLFEIGCRLESVRAVPASVDI